MNKVDLRFCQMGKLWYQHLKQKRVLQQLRCIHAEQYGFLYGFSMPAKNVQVKIESSVSTEQDQYILQQLCLFETYFI